jgi:hypothetical protein
MLKKKWTHEKLYKWWELPFHTCEDSLDSPLFVFIVLNVDSEGLITSRSGYDSTENLQKGAACPIFSRRKAIYYSYKAH